MRDHAHSRPRILFFGDPHGDFAPVINAVQRHRPQAIILLGDLQAQRPLHVELAPILDATDIWFIPGNHDTDSDADYDHLWGSELTDRNLHGRVAQIAGLKVAGLGGVFRESIWDPDLPMAQAKFESQDQLLQHVTRGPKRNTHDLWRGGISRRHRSSIFPAEYQHLAQQRADILVTHEAPRAHRHGWAAIDALALSLHAGLLVHGHHHESIDYMNAVEQYRMSHESPFRAFGVDKGSFLELGADGDFKQANIRRER